MTKEMADWIVKVKKDAADREKIGAPTPSSTPPTPLEAMKKVHREGGY